VKQNNRLLEDNEKSYDVTIQLLEKKKEISYKDSDEDLFGSNPDSS